MPEPRLSDSYLNRQWSPDGGSGIGVGKTWVTALVRRRMRCSEGEMIFCELWRVERDEQRGKRSEVGGPADERIIWT